MNYLLDTGPMIAFLDKRDHWHEWAIKQFNKIDSPLYTCEAVITEIVFLMLRQGQKAEIILDFVGKGDIIVKPLLTNKSHQQRIRQIIQNYHNLPASFADACLVTLAETMNDSSIFTLDNDFTIYRNRKGNPLSLIKP